MLMATFYPLIDGGFQQIIQVIRGLRQGAPIYGSKKNDSSPSSSFTESRVNEATNVQEEPAPKVKE